MVEFARRSENAGERIEALMELLSDYLKQNSKLAEQELSESQIAAIHERIVSRISEETDLANELEEILTVGEFLEPIPPINAINLEGEQGTDSTPVKKISGAEMRFANLMRRLFKAQPAVASYNPFRREIILPVGNKNNLFHSVVSMAAGKTEQLTGASLAHEALHAFQMNPLAPLDRSNEVRKATELQRSQPGLSFVEAVRMGDSSVDNIILNETQAYLLSYIFGAGSQDAVAMKRLTQGMEGMIKDLGAQVLLGDLDLSEYDSNGYPKLEELMLETITQDIPKIYRSSDTQTRIRTAYRQLTTLKELGMSHRAIALLMKHNSESIIANQSWNAEQGYVFLQEAINELARDKGLTDDGVSVLVEIAEKKKKQRGMRVHEISLEEFDRGIRAAKQF